MALLPFFELFVVLFMLTSWPVRLCFSLSKMDDSRSTPSSSLKNPCMASSKVCIITIVIIRQLHAVMK